MTFGNQITDGSDANRMLLSLMLDASVDCIKMIGLDGRLIQLNRSGRLALGLEMTDTTLGMSWVGLLPASVGAAARRALKTAINGKPAAFRGRSELPGQPPVHWENMLTPVHDPGGNMLAILCVSRDITRQVEAERKLRLASDCDPLTGIANVRLLRRQASRLAARAVAGRTRCGLLLIDVDDFKHVNDRGGHDAGDHVLRVTGSRLRRACLGNELPSRVGGDEFAILVGGVPSRSIWQTRHRGWPRPCRGRSPIAAPPTGCASASAARKSGRTVATWPPCSRPATLRSTG